MAKVICFINENGFASIVHIPPEMFDPNSATRKELESLGIVFNNEDEMIAWVAIKDVPSNAQYSVIDSSNLPADKQYRNAWVIRDDKSGVDVSLDKAKPIHQDNIRAVRANIFDSADIDFNKSVEKVLNKLMALIPDDQDVIALKAAIQKREDLRNAPSIDLSNVQSVDELKTKIPDVIK
jgi:hypothetical protein